MKNKSKLIFLFILSLTGIFMPGEEVLAQDRTPFTVNVTAGGYRDSGGYRKKYDYASAAVTPNSGIYGGIYVTFRVRFATGGGIATDYRDYSGHYRQYLPYYSGLAIAGEDYYLAASMDAGQSRNSATVKGYWAP
ncbi:hypothetical protein FEZ33_02435 [Ruoffia tabacinasalis]|uniref:Uncharacterized protein n=1 Tax=Ruoffia tabacinasalis TaxID=87458 RepID=A0A5R9EFC6_9LACT|nr:hypothetical protein [Ruoffia tabacinasalis]TLQ49095.1 hypothetical protein FEZ33_02435 [Ruoffia tabacinasalis]